jgi:hypothetical protein
MNPPIHSSVRSHSSLEGQGRQLYTARLVASDEHEQASTFVCNSKSNYYAVPMLYAGRGEERGERGYQMTTTAKGPMTNDIID